MSEDIELLRLRAKAKAKAERERGEALSTEEAPDSHTLPKAVAGGVVEAIPGAKYAAAGLETIGEAVMGEEDFSYETYKQNLDENEQTLRDLEKKHPVAFGVGEFGTTMAGAAVLGPVNVARQAVFGAAQGLSKTGDPKQGLFQGAVAGLLTKLGVEIPKLFAGKKAALLKNMNRMADETSLSVTTPKGNAGAITRVKQIIDKRYNGDISKAAKHVEEIVDLKMVQSPDELANAAESSRQMIGKKIGETLDTVDDHLKSLGKGSEKVVDGGILQAELKNTIGGKSRFMVDEGVPDVLKPSFKEIDQFIDDITLTTKTSRRNVFNKVEMPDGQGGKIVDYKPAVEESSEVVARQLGAKDIFNIKVRVANHIEDVFEKKLLDKTLSKSDAMKISMYKSQIVGKLADKLDDAMYLSLDKLKDPNAAKAVAEFTDLNQKYGMASHISALAKEEALKKLHMSAFERGTALIGFKGFFLSAMGGAAGGPAGIGLGLTLNHIMKHPATPIKLARQMRKLADYAARNPDGKLLRPLTIAMANKTDPEVIENVLDSVIAKVHADDNPIGRDIDSVYENASVISTILRDEAGDEIAQQFNDAVDTHDDATIGAFMEGVSKMPGASRFIQPGRGWNGLVHDPQEKVKMATEIEKMDISRLQKSKLKQGLKINSDEPGIIPQVEPEPERFMKYQTRNKKKPKF